MLVLDGNLVRIALILALITSFSTLATSENYEDSFRIHEGGQIQAEDYNVRVEDPGFESEGLQLEVTEEMKYSERLLLQETVEDFSKDETKYFEIPEKDILVAVNRIGWTGKGRYLNITVTAQENIFALSELDASIPENVVVSREEEISVPLTLSNKGTKNQSVSLDYSSSPGISVRFSYGGFNVTKVEMGTGESETISSTMSIKEEAELGRHNVTFSAFGLSNATESISFVVIGSEKEKSMELDIDQNFIQTRAGERIRISPTIRNTGDGILEEVELDIETPDGWDIENNRMMSASSLRSRDRDRMYRRIRVPSNAEPGDYYLELTPTSEELEGETQEIRVNIREKSGMSNVGIALMLISLIGMVGTYRKLGRR